MTNEEFIKSVSLEGEEWSDVVGYEGLYKVSSFGRIISLSRTIKNRYGERMLNPLIMNPQMNNKGYYNIILRKKGNIQHFLIHRLVAIHFICNNLHYDEIDHIDGNKANNNFDNLRWCNRKSNMRNKNTKEKLSQNASKRINEKNGNQNLLLESILTMEMIYYFSNQCVMQEGMDSTKEQSPLYVCTKGNVTKTINGCIFPTTKPLSISQRTLYLMANYPQ